MRPRSVLLRRVPAGVPGAPRSSRTPSAPGPAPSGPGQLPSPRSLASGAPSDSGYGRTGADDGGHERGKCAASGVIARGLQFPQAQDRNRGTLPSDGVGGGTPARRLRGVEQEGLAQGAVSGLEDTKLRGPVATGTRCACMSRVPSAHTCANGLSSRPGEAEREGGARHHHPPPPDHTAPSRAV